MNFTANNVHAEITISSTAAARGCVRQINVNGKDLHLTIPARIKDGQTLRLKGGGYAIGGGEPGDLYVKISIQHSSTSPQQERVESEGEVEKSVINYLSRLRQGVTHQRFSVKPQYTIQIGSRQGRPDVVLIDDKGYLAAVVECKKSGHTGHGVEQLKSYLCATDTQFGIFANSTKPESWTFYENLRRNRFEKISRFDFERKVFSEWGQNKQRQRHIEELEKQKSALVNEISRKKRHFAQEERHFAQKKQERQLTLENLSEQIRELTRKKSALETGISKVESKVAWKHFLVALRTGLTVTCIGAIVDVFSGAADALSTMVMVFLAVFFVEKLVNAWLK